MDIWTKKKSPEEPFFHVSYIALHLQLYSCKMLDSALYPDLYFLSKKKGISYFCRMECGIAWILANINPSQKVTSATKY
jgi:hypothetical protein